MPTETRALTLRSDQTQPQKLPRFVQIMPGGQLPSKQMLGGTSGGLHGITGVAGGVGVGEGGKVGRDVEVGAGVDGGPEVDVGTGGAVGSGVAVAAAVGVNVATAGGVGVGVAGRAAFSSGRGGRPGAQAGALGLLRGHSRVGSRNPRPRSCNGRSTASRRKTGSGVVLGLTPRDIAELRAQRIIGENLLQDP